MNGTRDIMRMFTSGSSGLLHIKNTMKCSMYILIKSRKKSIAKLKVYKPLIGVFGVAQDICFSLILILLLDLFLEKINCLMIKFLEGLVGCHYRFGILGLVFTFKVHVGYHLCNNLYTDGNLRNLVQLYISFVFYVMHRNEYIKHFNNCIGVVSTVVTGTLY